MRVRVPVTRDQRRRLSELSAQSGLSAAMHIRHAVMAYLEDPDRAREGAWERASEQRSDGVIAVRLPVALRDELAAVGARTGLTMTTQFRVALAHALGGSTDSAQPPRGAESDGAA